MKNTQIEQLEAQGCYSDDWSRISISEKTDLRKIRNVIFRGDVSIGAGAEILNVPGGLCNVRIGDNVRIENVARIETSETPTFGVGSDIDVLDETGQRVVRIFPGISAQLATAAARVPDFADRFFRLADAHIAAMPDRPEIGDNAVITDCGPISDVRVWSGVRIEGARHLSNGSVVNNSSCGKPLAYVGHGVDAENFIFEDSIVSGGALIRNCYVGQGSVIDKGFTAHDSLFFANCSMENGEACAVLAGPYTVSMHKSSLLIGCQTSFMNAGSGTNMSNHMYKFGPVHWGVLERGVKTASNAYIMHGSHIGAFSLVMGDHKTHPDSSMFPFSYLFGDPKGATTIVPGAMLKSYGLRRDAEKWPSRDRREGHGLPLHDRINFSLLNPMTIGAILKGQRVLDSIVEGFPQDSGVVTKHGLRFGLNKVSEGIRLYDMAVSQYVERLFGDSVLQFPEPHSYETVPELWIDLCGQLLPVSVAEKALEADSVEEFEKIMTTAHENYDPLQRQWAIANLNVWFESAEDNREQSEKLEEMAETDRNAAADTLSAHEHSLRLF